MDFGDAPGIIVPAYNSAIFLDTTLKGILQKYPAAKIVVVDDGSVDKTGEKALALGVSCLVHERNLGKGAALMTGLTWARKQGWKWAVTMDADGQHDISDLESFRVTPCTDKTAILVGRRSIRGTSMPLHRRFSNYLTTCVISLLASKPVYDAQCGYRMYRLDVLDKLVFPIQGRFEWEAQVLVLACRAGYTVAAVDIATVYTDNGTHMHLVRDTLRFLKMVWRLAWTL